MAEQNDDSNLIFTRYLYSLSEVKHSLFLSILDKKSDEALFWLYEIYYSGFPDAALELVINIYNDVFAFDNPDLVKPFNRIITNFEETPSENDDVAVGTMVHNMCLRKHRIGPFMKTYLGVVCEPEPDPDLTKKYFYITLKRDNIQQYKTLPHIERPYTYLKTACKYPIRKEGNKIFSGAEDNEFRSLWFNNWIYFAYKSPIWKERIEEYGGEPIRETKKIVFYNENQEEDEDLESDFYDMWNMETDEQTIEVSNAIIGNSSVQYLSISEFCNKYGGVLKKRTITKKISKSIKTHENTIVIAP